MKNMKNVNSIIIETVHIIFGHFTISQVVIVRESTFAGN